MAVLYEGKDVSVIVLMYDDVISRVLSSVLPLYMHMWQIHVYISMYTSNMGLCLWYKQHEKLYVHVHGGKDDVIVIVLT